jgi:hypothetical protein
VLFEHTIERVLTKLDCSDSICAKYFNSIQLFACKVGVIPVVYVEFEECSYSSFGARLLTVNYIFTVSEKTTYSSESFLLTVK